MTTLAALSEEYRDAAVRLRAALEETEERLAAARGPERRDLERRARILRQMLREARDLRDLTEGYYTRDRDGRYTTSTLRAPKWDALK